MKHIFEGLYDEFGEDQTHIVRREITAKTGSQPSYMELLSALSIKKGYVHILPKITLSKPMVTERAYQPSLFPLPDKENHE